MKAQIENPSGRPGPEGLRKRRGDDENGKEYKPGGSPIETLLSRLDGVRHIGGSKWLARCPAHEDRTPSLSIRETEEGTVLLHDFAGCSAGEVLAAVGMEFTELFPEGPVSHHIKSKKRPRQRTSDVLAAVSHALTVVSLVDSKLAQDQPLNDDERKSVARALRVLGQFQREARVWR